ncbi:MAG: carbohydrate-binding domain-containing protein [Clostridia bacterium]|nr:carbohydrate-binding domain-containing protein [Clostridia bacterium]
MKKWISMLLSALLLLGAASAQESETLISLGDAITVNGKAIPTDASAPVHLEMIAETHEDVPEDLKTLENSVVVISSAGSYRVSGTAQNTQILIRAGKEDKVRLILDGVDITCRTAPAIAVESAFDARVAGEYGVTIELADGSENLITGSHTKAPDDDEAALEYDGAIGAQVSLGFEGTGSLTIDADNEGIEVASGHMTINGGVFTIMACDDPLNVAEDGVGTLTVNDGYVYSAVKPLEGGEGDGIDSNGYIVFNGGTVINLAHPASGDSGIDSDMGSTINGGLIVGAGNMYDPIDANSGQLFMMLEFAEATNQLVVVTDENDQPVFAYDFPHDYMYIAFSTPELKEGVYRVYLGGEIEGEQTNGLYTSITAYVPGTRMQHGEGTAQMRMGGSMTPPQMGGEAPDMPQGGAPQMPEGMADMMAYQQALESLDLNEVLKDVDLNALLKTLDLNELLSAYDVADLLNEEQIAEHFGDIDLSAVSGFDRGFGRMGREGMGGGFGGGMGGPRSLESSADTATTDFALSKDSTGFTNVQSAK